MLPAMNINKEFWAELKNILSCCIYLYFHTLSVLLVMFNPTLCKTYYPTTDFALDQFLDMIPKFHIKKTPWPQSARELYRQSGCRRSAKLVPTFADRGVSHGQRKESPQPLISVFLTWSRYFFHSSSSSIDLMRLSGPRSRPTTTQKIW